jgi:hypothetical protein
MITLKQFIRAIHEAVVQASDSLMDKNIGLLDHYFEQSSTDEKALVPKTVNLEFYSLSADGASQVNKVQVPLVTLVPISIPRIERATLTTDFEMEVVDGELQIDFKGSRRPSALGKMFGNDHDKRVGRLEIVMTPQDTPEGLRLVVDAYESTLKRQLS